MNEKEVIAKIPVGTLFDKQQFRAVVHSISPCYSEASVNWLIGKLKQEKEIQVVGRGKYIRTEKERGSYEYHAHSMKFQMIEELVKTEYPLVIFQMWELIQMNEFVNHQIAKNVIFVEVENMLEEPVFHLLHENYPHVLFSPTKNQFYRQKGIDDTVVVQKIISEAPRSIHAHACVLEKILVDIFSNKITGELIEKSEYKGILEDSFAKYQIDESKLLRYARRRNREQDIRCFIEEYTDIKLTI